MIAILPFSEVEWRGFPGFEVNWPQCREPAPWEFFTLAIFGLN
jgi:hypothetical protein